MALKDVFKVSRKTFFNPSAWLGYDTVKGTTQTIWGIAKGVFTIQEPQRKETFEEALTRLNLTETDIQESAKNYFLFALIFAACALGTLIYGLYLLFFHHTFLGFLLALSVVIMLSAQAFRFHFWYFQIKQRKLGCTFEEWWQGKLNANQEPKQ